MQSFWRLLGYLRNFKLKVALNVLSNILTAIFTAISIPVLIPFLEILFDRTELVTEKPEWSFKIENIINSVNYQLSQVIIKQGVERALIYVCIAIMLIFFF